VRFLLSPLLPVFLLPPPPPGPGPWFWTGVGSCAALALYVFRGWQLSGTGLRGLLELLRAPFFLLWKIALMFRSRRTSEWVRTKREGG
jgi:hypothetical protein